MGRYFVVVDAKEHPHLKVVRPEGLLRNMTIERDINTSSFSENFETDGFLLLYCLKEYRGLGLTQIAMG